MKTEVYNMLFDVIHIESCSSDNIFWWIHFQIGPYNNVKNAIYMPGVVILIKFLSDHFDSQVWLDASDTCRYTEQKKKAGLLQ